MHKAPPKTNSNTTIVSINRKKPSMGCSLCTIQIQLLFLLIIRLLILHLLKNKHSNTTIVSINPSKFYAFLFPSKIQIQLLFLLIIIEIPARPTFGPNSNTTIVSINLDEFTREIRLFRKFKYNYCFY